MDKKTSFLLWAAFYTAVSLAIILFSSPLFRVLGFEYSGLISLWVSIHVLFFSAFRAASLSELGYLQILKDLWLRVLFFSTIPLGLSLISVVVIPNCALADGVLFYLQIVYPTAVIALGAGVLIGIHARTRTRLILSLSAFWLATFFASLLPGYFSSCIYTYGWQYGYFPGLMWDEAMVLSKTYWLTRALDVMLFATLSYITLHYRTTRTRLASPYSSKGENASRTSPIRLMLYLLLIGLIFYFRAEAVVPSVANILPDSVLVETVDIHLDRRSFTTDELALLKYEVRSYVAEIDSSYDLRSPRRIDIYLFSNADELYECVGTREASITKPWMHSIYIAKANLSSLKHELVHAMLATFGSYPFDMSWSTGLTEGAAVAIEDDYDGIHSADEFAAGILDMDLSPGIGDIMRPSGFLSAAPSISYALSGSFTRYLLQQFGPKKFLSVYSNRDFESVYSQGLWTLESNWKKQIAIQVGVMDHYDSLRTLYYFKRTSILHQPCVRRIGKLLLAADLAYKEKNYREADSLYEIVTSESGRLRAIRGRVLSQLHLNNPMPAWRILDTTSSANEMNNLNALRQLRGDVLAFATGDLDRARIEWKEAMRLELGENSFLASFIRLYFVGAIANVGMSQAVLRQIDGLEESKNTYQLIFTPEPRVAEDEAFYKARLLLYVSFLERSGQLSAAYSIWNGGARQIAAISTRAGREPARFEGDGLFKKLVRKKFRDYDSVFGEPTSAASTRP